ncbi:hypothetical protein BGX23_012677 [Mortierella sp. AD031]|nr:hypothetical protein BGX23_012677 [Mortierella sp. AD031]
MNPAQSSSSPTAAVILSPSTNAMKPDMGLQIPELLALIGSFLPLFEHRYEAGKHRFIDVWDPQILLAAASVSRRWYRTMKPILWPNNHTLVQPKFSGTCGRMHPFLLNFVERLGRLEILELTRFTFTRTDWRCTLKSKPSLRKLSILQQCVFERLEDTEDRATDKGKGKSKAQEQPLESDYD